MKKLLLSLLFISSLSTLSAQKKSNKTVIKINNRVEMWVPESFESPSFVANDSTHVTLKNKKNLAMLIYQLATPNQPTAVDIADNDIPMWTDKQLSALRGSQTFTYIDDGIFLQDGKNIGYIKYKSDQKESFDTYNLLFFMSVDGKLFQVTFFCQYKIRKHWEPIADEIANSLRIIPAE